MWGHMEDKCTKKADWGDVLKMEDKTEIETAGFSTILGKGRRKGEMTL